MSASENIASKVFSNRVPLTPFDYIESPINKPAEKKSFAKKIVAVFTKGISAASDKWDYSDKSITLTRRFFAIILNAGAQTAKACAELSTIDAHFKVLALGNTPFELASVPSKINNIWKNIMWKDFRGLAHSAVLLTLTLAALFDDVTTAISGVLHIQSLPPIEWISNMAAPFGIALSSAVALTKCNHLYQLSKFNRELNRKILAIESGTGSAQELRRLISPFLNKHLGEGSSRTKAQANLKRNTSPEVLAEMLEIENLLNDGDDHMDQIIVKLKTLKLTMKSKKQLESGLLVAATISIIAWSLFLTPAAPVAPFILMAISIAMQIGLKVHHNWKQKKIAKLEIQSLSA